jgi:hypothetical protein
MNKFICPQWIRYYGNFDQSMYHIDHIKELTNGGTNKINNLQALCPQCHSVKTNYMKRIVHTGIEKRNVSNLIKKQVAARQLFKCANTPPIGIVQCIKYRGIIGVSIGLLNPFIKFFST